jgi:protein-S-isoprenylcysteine O-methyltransferase Ste14
MPVKLIDLSLVAFWSYFAYNTLISFIRYGKIGSLVLFIAETITVFLFLIRNRPQSVSSSPSDFFVAIVGTFMILLYRPVAHSDLKIGDTIAFGALVILIGALLSLNKHFGIVPANRGIETKGLYAYVRHPIYVSYIIMYVGILMSNWSLFNAVIIGLAYLFIFLRIGREENHLKHDPQYQEYSRNVRWQLIPWIF